MYNANQEEQKILDFWQKDNTFEKSINTRPENKPYVFYDGPPFATGLPHYGHILSSVIKDVVPRYWTMKGYRVRRRWGWDCHGLPIENLIEKELKISGKKEIDAWGIEKFNEACRSKVLMYTHEWKKMVTRIGRWVEFDNAYKTMDPTYMESVWWSLKTIWDKGLIYEGRKVLMYCPHCETPVSKAEIAMDNSYKDITEESVTAKFKVKNPEKHGLPENTYILAWTTTPWTLPGNVALAVGKNIGYTLVNVSKYETYTRIKTPGLPEQFAEKNESEYNLIVAKDRKEEVLKKLDGAYTEVRELMGADLISIEYEPLFDMPAMRETGKKAYYVADADFVTTEEGTGIVHTAVIYGEDDYNLGLKLDLPMVPMLNEKGEFNEVAPEFFRGQYFKKAEKAIKADLENRGLLFSREQYTHSYPHCWRCETQLFYNAISAWFINIQKVKDRMIELNEKINWHPDHLKHGRFLNILETAPDWNISRNRYWATPLPFWKCTNEACKETLCIGSVQELKEKATNFNDVFATDKVEEMDLHKHIVDRIKLPCEKCDGVMERIPEVIDCWVESGSMPFAEFHYPFESQKTFEKRFPGQFIAEYINQTRAWFYYMHAMAVLLFDSNSFENCVTTGEIQNEKGEKLSKSKKNYPDPWMMIEKYGVDAMRYYMMTSPVMEADNLLFNEREVKDVYNKVLNILDNVLAFYKMYEGEYDGKTSAHGSKHILDRWILAKLQALVKEVTHHMDKYSTVHAGRPLKDFIDELSTWYVRRSRERFKSDDGEDKQHALATMREVLLTLSKLMAPFTPFIAEKVWQEVGANDGQGGYQSAPTMPPLSGRGVLPRRSGTPSILDPESAGHTPSSSVHLQLWPQYHAEHHDHTVLEQMAVARKIVEMGLALRAENKIRVRQPLAALLMNKENLSHELLQIIADELNVKHVEFAEYQEPGNGWAEKVEGEISVWLNTTVDEQLKKEGLLREVIRTINQMRKDQKLTIADRVVVKYQTDDRELLEVFSEFGEEIKRAVLASQLVGGGAGETPLEIEGKQFYLVLSPA